MTTPADQPDPIRCTSTTRPHHPPYGTRVLEEDTGLIQRFHSGAYGSGWSVDGTTDARRPPAYRALLAATDGLAREMVELHRPEPDIVHGNDVRRWRCAGCDAEGCDWEHPEWPCRTSQLAAERADVSLREDHYTVESG
ncbi:hypothetical protein [Micromonospora sp. CB01531]|uniref:hypothetical protein n=1 Tax=Micromonospora sp. CB01531 TaxID=1718947 RepID=UPI000939944E|nr:hypothetical protein [Micromonospora sp. CB01531]OKI47292.1 hypothetical protein A6A27_10620 [Micromonospora sp. CB01531]